MFEDNSQSKMKSDLLFKQFSDYGYSESTRISQSELLLFLNRKSPTGKFDENICQKLFEFLDINESNTITIEQFVHGAQQFESQFINNVESIKAQFLQQQNIYNSLLEQCQKYENSKYNEHGFCEGAKFYGEIVNVQIQKYLEATEDIILTLNYNGQQKEIRQKYSQNGNVILNAPFEFIAKSKKENFQFHLQGDMGYGYVYELGTKTFALSEINNQEEFYVKIEIPEIPKYGQIEQKIVAEINAKICMIWSYFELYEERRKIEEPKLNQLRNELEEAEEQLKRVDKIYDEKVRNSFSIEEGRENINLNETKSNKKGKISFQDRGIRNNKKFEFPGKNFVVKFNFIRMDENKNKGMNVDFEENMNFGKVDKSYQTINLEQNHVENEQKNEENNKSINEHDNYNMNFSKNENIENNFQMQQRENVESLGQNVELERSFGANMLKNEDIPKDEDEEKEEIKKQNNEIDNNNQDMNPNFNLNEGILQKSNISQNSNVIQNSNSIQNSNMLQQPITSQNPNISQKMNDIQNSNMLQKSNILQNSQISHHSNALQSTNINNSHKFNETQNQNIHQDSNTLQQSNAMQNLDILQQSNSINNLNMIQQSNSKQNKNLNEQLNKAENSNVFPSSNKNPNSLKNSSMSQKSNVVQNQFFSQNQIKNIEHNSNIFQSNVSHHSNVNQNIIPNNPFNSINEQQNISQRQINISSSNFPMPSSNEINFNQGQNSLTFQKPIINKSLTETMVIKEDTLPVKYLPDKVNEPIFENVVNTLPLLESKKNISYSTAQTNVAKNLLGSSQVNQYNPTILSYQQPMPNDQQYHSMVISLKKV